MMGRAGGSGGREKGEKERRRKETKHSGAYL